MDYISRDIAIKIYGKTIVEKQYLNKEG